MFDQSIMVEQLIQWCEINSGSENLPGLLQMHDQLQLAFAPLADAIQSYDCPPVPLISMHGESYLQRYGNTLVIQKRPHLKRRVLLSGHMDTVYGTEHPFQTLIKLDNNTLNGPGVADMKGGLVIMLHALQAFEQTSSASKLGWDVIINGDEEIGSLASSNLLSQLSSTCQAALVYEPSMSEGNLFAKHRKGSGKITLVAHGRAAHAGRNFAEGRNAICFLAKVITEIDALNGLRAGVTLNVGKIAGGSALNIVPDTAVAKIDVRIEQPDDETWVKQQLERVQDQYRQSDNLLTLEMTSIFNRPVKQINTATERLFSSLQETAQGANLSIDWKDSGGCCDGNNFSQQGIAVIDSLGARGGKIHTADEYILMDSLPERAALSTNLLINLAEGGLETLYQ